MNKTVHPSASAITWWMQHADKEGRKDGILINSNTAHRKTTYLTNQPTNQPKKPEKHHHPIQNRSTDTSSSMVED